MHTMMLIDSHISQRMALSSTLCLAMKVIPFCCWLLTPLISMQGFVGCTLQRVQTLCSISEAGKGCLVYVGGSVCPCMPCMHFYRGCSSFPFQTSADHPALV